MFDLLLATSNLPEKALPVSWQNYIIWILAIVIILLVGYIVRQYDKKGAAVIKKFETKHNEAIGRFDSLISSTNNVNTSLVDVGSKIEKIFENDKETKWALQNQNEKLIKAEAQLETLSKNIESQNKAIINITKATNNMSKKLKCQEKST